MLRKKSLWSWVSFLWNKFWFVVDFLPMFLVFWVLSIYHVKLNLLLVESLKLLFWTLISYHYWLNKWMLPKITVVTIVIDDMLCWTKHFFQLMSNLCKTIGESFILLDSGCWNILLLFSLLLFYSIYVMTKLVCLFMCLKIFMLLAFHVLASGNVCICFFTLWPCDFYSSMADEKNDFDIYVLLGIKTSHSL